MGCSCNGGGAKARANSDGTSGTVAWRHWSGETAGEGGRSDYATEEQATEAVRVLGGGVVQKVDPATGREVP